MNRHDGIINMPILERWMITQVDSIKNFLYWSLTRAQTAQNEPKNSKNCQKSKFKEIWASLQDRYEKEFDWVDLSNHFSFQNGLIYDLIMSTGCFFFISCTLRCLRMRKASVAFLPNLWLISPKELCILCNLTRVDQLIRNAEILRSKIGLILWIQQKY